MLLEQATDTKYKNYVNSSQRLPQIAKGKNKKQLFNSPSAEVKDNLEIITDSPCQDSASMTNLENDTVIAKDLRKVVKN